MKIAAAVLVAVIATWCAASRYYAVQFENLAVSKGYADRVTFEDGSYILRWKPYEAPRYGRP